MVGFSCNEYSFWHEAKFCVSEIRQNGNWQRINVAENWLDPLVTNRPEGGGGMRAGTA